MTRETKIGLLVGLAFIIVIGILLSDHLTSSTEPPPAALTSAAGTVRGAIASPGSGSAAANGSYPPVANVNAPTVTPQQTVPTASDLKPPVQIVAIGPATATPDPTANSQQSAADPRVVIGAPESTTPNPSTADATTNPPAAQQSAPQPPTNAVASANTAPQPTGSNDQDLANIAASHGEPLVTSDGKPLAPGHFGATATTSARQYTAQEGDSLSKMAGRFLGANTKANRDAIIRLNPQLKANPDIIIVGKAYRIPTASAPASVATSAPQPASTDALATNPAPAPRQVAPAATAGDIWYVVKPNDSLWRIANDQLGSASEVDAIKELNQNVLKGENHDTIYAGMRLKLPSKPLAQAN